MVRDHHPRGLGSVYWPQSRDASLHSLGQKLTMTSLESCPLDPQQRLQKWAACSLFDSLCVHHRSAAPSRSQPIRSREVIAGPFRTRVAWRHGPNSRTVHPFGVRVASRSAAASTGWRRNAFGSRFRARPGSAPFGRPSPSPRRSRLSDRGGRGSYLSAPRQWPCSP